jgi:O-antigen ligase
MYSRMSGMTSRASPLLIAERPLAGVASPTIGTGHLPFAVTMYFLLIALPIHFNLGPIFMTGTRAVLLVTSIPLTIRLFSGQLGRVMPTDVLLLIYSAWSIVTLFINSADYAISFGGSYVLEVYGSYLLARNYIRTPEQFRAMCRGLFVLLIFTLPFAIYETQTGRALIPTLIAKLPGIYSWADFYNFLAGRRLGLERSQVIFSHPIHYGLFCASLISLALVAFKGLMSSARCYLAALLVCVGVICSVSSGAILPMILQIGLLFWAWAFSSIRRRWIILCGIIAVCYVVVDMLSNRTPVTVFLSYAALSKETAYARINIFEWGMNNVWKNPYFGIGMNEWERPSWKSGSMDNFWLLTTVRYGIPGFLLLGSAYLLPVWAAMRRDLGDSGPTWQFRRAWVFLQVGMILTLCTVDVWSTALSYVFFLFGAGAWLVSAQPDATSTRETADQVAMLPRHPGTSYTRFNVRRVRHSHTW